MLLDLDPDSHFKYGSGARTFKPMRIHADPDPNPDTQYFLKPTSRQVLSCGLFVKFWLNTVLGNWNVIKCQINHIWGTVPAFLRKHAEDFVTYEEVVPRVRAWLCSDLSFPFVVNICISYFMIFICCCRVVFRNHKSVRMSEEEEFDKEHFSQNSSIVSRVISMDKCPVYENVPILVKEEPMDKDNIQFNTLPCDGLVVDSNLEQVFVKDEVKQEVVEELFLPGDDDPLLRWAEYMHNAHHIIFKVVSVRWGNFFHFSIGKIPCEDVKIFILRSFSSITVVVKLMFGIRSGFRFQSGSPELSQCRYVRIRI